MANEIVNRIMIKGDKNEVSKMYNSIKRDKEEAIYGIGLIDFNKIEPMPKEIISLELENGCAEDGYFRWTNKYWGSKGNCVRHSNKMNTENDIWFETSGGKAKKIVEKLSGMFPNIEIEYSWYDGFNLGCNVGKCIYKNGNLLESITFDNRNKETYNFILDLEECTADKLGLRYNSEVDNYEYKE